MSDRVSTLQVTERYPWTDSRLRDLARYVPELTRKERISEAFSASVLTWDVSQLEIMRAFTEVFGMTLITAGKLTVHATMKGDKITLTVPEAPVVHALNEERNAKYLEQKKNAFSD